MKYFFEQYVWAFVTSTAHYRGKWSKETKVKSQKKSNYQKPTYFRMFTDTVENTITNIIL
jgi:hypothetical protein